MTSNTTLRVDNDPDPWPPREVEDEQIAQFLLFTGTDDAVVATRYLGMCCHDLDQAVDFFLTNAEESPIGHLNNPTKLPNLEEEEEETQTRKVHVPPLVPSLPVAIAKRRSKVTSTSIASEEVDKKPSGSAAEPKGGIVRGNGGWGDRMFDEDTALSALWSETQTTTLKTDASRAASETSQDVVAIDPEQENADVLAEAMARFMLLTTTEDPVVAANLLEICSYDVPQAVDMYLVHGCEYTTNNQANGAIGTRQDATLGSSSPTAPCSVCGPPQEKSCSVVASGATPMEHNIAGGGTPAEHNKKNTTLEVDDELVAQFMRFTSSENPQEALTLLMKYSGNLQQAVAKYNDDDKTRNDNNNNNDDDEFMKLTSGGSPSPAGKDNVAKQQAQLDELVVQFLQFTGSSDPDEAQTYLATSSCNVQQAVALFHKQNEGRRKPSTSATAMAFHDRAGTTDQEAKKQSLLEAVRSDGFSLRKASETLRADPDIVLAAVQNKGVLALKFAAPTLRDDLRFFRSLLVDHNVSGHALQFATKRLQANKGLVLCAVSKNGTSLAHASPRLQACRELVLAAVRQDGRALRYASPTLQQDGKVLREAVGQQPQLLEGLSDDLKSDPQMVLAAVRGDVSMMKLASDSMRGQKEFGREVVKLHGTTLQHLTWKLRSDRDVVLAAVRTCGSAIQYAFGGLREDKEVVVAALGNDGSLLSSLPNYLRADKECVLAAVSNQPEALKFALDGLAQDKECLIASGLWDEDYHDNFNGNGGGIGGPPSNKIVLSTRFALDEASSPTATEFTILLKQHSYFRDEGGFRVYSPNAFNKKSCDPDWTNIDWPCRGTSSTCHQRCTGPPTLDSCWRYSFRYHLEDARRRGGFMMQVVELSATGGHTLGKGQEIETLMAAEVGVKVFQIYQPAYEKSNVADNGKSKSPLRSTMSSSPSHFRREDIDELALHVKRWYQSGCTGVEQSTIHFDRRADAGPSQYYFER